VILRISTSIYFTSVNLIGMLTLGWRSELYIVLLYYQFYTMEKNVIGGQLTQANFHSSEFEVDHSFANNEDSIDVLPTFEAVKTEVIVDAREDKKDFKAAVFEEPHIEPGPPPYSARVVVLKEEQPKKNFW
jgi:hypothetical protein